MCRRRRHRGLITALALQRKGIRAKVFEKVKEYKLFGGSSIALGCNAQAALDSIAPDVLEKVWEKSTITYGDRVARRRSASSALVLPLRHPPAVLQRARAAHPRHREATSPRSRRDAVGQENIEMETVVEKYENKGDKVVATLKDGTASREPVGHERRRRCRR